MKKIVLFFCSVSLCATGFSQVQNNRVENAEFDADNKPAFVRFEESSDYGIRDAKNILSEMLSLQQNDALIETDKTVDELGFTHIEYQQYFKGVRVEYGRYKVHARNDKISVVNGEFKAIDQNLSVVPAISEAVALEKAIRFVGAREYIWNTPDASMYYTQVNGTYAPKAELVVVNNYENKNTTQSTKYVLAYKFDIYASNPVGRQYVYVHAQTGQIVHTNVIMKHANAPGTAATRYSGTQSITTDSYNGGYRLREIRGTGLGIETYNIKNTMDVVNAVDFMDMDNNWSAAEYNNANLDNAALDVHWATEKVYDYWKNVHGRNSYDDKGAKLKSYVHYYDGKSKSNAVWDGSVMLYGDGDPNQNHISKPWTSLDLCAHEIGHAVCQATCNLIYNDEPGAINEALSDIWAACVENYAAPNKNIWLLAEEVVDGGERSMSNPNVKGDPDTYYGTYWLISSGDDGGVHTNSGVLNYCFYLMCVGGNGTNDHGKSFNVTGISIAKAEKIVFRAERFYLTSNSNYPALRTALINAATDLYGANSAEVLTTKNALSAVGLDGTCPSSIIINFGLIATKVDLKQEASDYILASNFVDTFGGYAVKYDAGKYILLSPGFQAKAPNGYFSAYIDGCGGNMLVNPKPPIVNIITAQANTPLPDNTAAEATKMSLEVYPNPFTDRLTVKYEFAADNSQVRIEVFSLKGAKVADLLPKDSRTAQGTYSLEWDTGNLPDGIYLIVLTTDTGEKIQKTVIKS